MGLIMFYDTETTGLWRFKEPWNAPSQPHMVQLGFKVQDIDTRLTIYEVGALVNSTTLKDWRGIEPDAEVVHKVSEQSIIEHGVNPIGIMKAFDTWARKCSMFANHNEPFDYSVMQAFALRTGYNPGIFPDGAPRFCTMRSSTNICKIPSPKGGGYKWPKLVEAYPVLFNTGFKDAHNALADVNAAADIFWHLVDIGALQIRGSE